MAIQTFNNQAQAIAVSGPKLIWHNVDKWIVFTGADIPTKSQEQTDREDAAKYAKLSALSAMTPAQVQAWVETNVTTLAQAKDAIKTLAVAVSILARQL